MAGITIPIATDTRQAVKETNDLAKGFDKVADSLDDVEKNSRTTGDKLEDSLKGAQKETKQTTDAFEKLGKAQRDASSGGADFGRDTTRGLRDVGDTSKEVGGELKQNIGETFSSFRGDVTDFGQVAQDTLGGLASGLEGIPGIALVAAGAAGIGLILGALENGQNQTAAWKQDVADLTGQYIDAGNIGSRAVDDIVDELKKLATTGDDAGVTLDKLATLGDRTGDSLEDIAKAYTGNSRVLRDHIAANTDYAKTLEKQLTSINANNDAERASTGPLTDKITALQSLNDVYRQAAEKAEAAEKAAKEFEQSGAAGLQAKAEQIKTIDQAYDDAAGAAEDYVNAESGVFDVDKYATAMEAKAKALDAFKANFQKAALTLSPEAQQYIESQGAEAQQTFTQAYVDASPEQQARLNAVWSTAGKTSATSYVGALQANMPGTINGPRVVINDVDTSRIPGLIQQSLNGHHYTVPVWANVRVGNAVT